MTPMQTATASLEQNLLTASPPCSIIESRQRIMLMAIRQALIIALGALEDYLSIERSIVPRHKRA